MLGTTRLHFGYAVAALGLVAAGCGTSDTSSRVLESISVTPATASALSGGQVQFTATGSFSKPPSPPQVAFVAPYSGGWQTSDPSITTIDEAGMAQCAAGAAGTVTVIAEASANKSSGPAAMSVGVRGTAQLTCP